MKQIKFAGPLAAQIQAGTKTSTLRLFDDKDVAVGDEVQLVNSDTQQVFGSAVITVAYEKAVGELKATDLEGNAPFTTHQSLLETFREFYGDRATLAAPVKVVHFAVRQLVD